MNNRLAAVYKILFEKRVRYRMMFGESRIKAVKNITADIHSNLHVIAFQILAPYTDEVIQPEGPFSKQKGACYRNSIKYASKHSDVEWALGTCWVNYFAWEKAVKAYKLPPKDSLHLLEKDNFHLGGVNSWSVGHGFCVKNNVVIDPTLVGKYDTNRYFYKVVPRSKWDEFSIKDDFELQFECMRYINKKLFAEAAKQFDTSYILPK
jgi:hypothetical protein